MSKEKKWTVTITNIEIILLVYPNHRQFNTEESTLKGIRDILLFSLKALFLMSKVNPY